ncbi:MAG: HlyD family efflux transporter periplasmic adaptor subunit [Eubacteriales bacterium]|nr:HlyD family efflux transporter periplasmic adaptor subunit [Eubacteriales bacterium]
MKGRKTDKFGMGESMKKGIKKLIIISAAVAVAACTFFVVRAKSANAEEESAFDTEYAFDDVTTGDISLSVSGSGNLESAETFDIVSGGYLIIDKVQVEAGDTIAAGDTVATLDVEAMEEYADTLEAEIMSLQTEIDTTNSVTTTLSIKSVSDGWVKNAVLDEDDYIEDAMGEYGYVALVATEKRELIDASESELALGDEVKVKCEGYTMSGVVTNEDGRLCVSIDTVKRTVGAEAVVYDTDGNELFSGVIELAAYDVIESSYGIITDVNFSEDEAIDQGDTIYRATQYSMSVQDLYDSIADYKAQYDAVQGLIEAGVVTSPSAGVVTSVSVSDDGACEADTVLMSIESTDNWCATVSVDELDINSIEIGQSVEVTVDSLPDDVFTGEVVGISDYGTASGGITTYPVDISIEDNAYFKINMTLNCEIMAEEALGAVIVPVDDVRTTGTKSYVMVAVERTDEEIAAIKQLILNDDYDGLAAYMGDDASVLGISVLSDPAELLYAEVCAVETGIENAYYIEIKSGLTEGESVIQLTSDSSTSADFERMDMGVITDMGGMTGNVPSGGGSMSGGSAPFGN